MRPERNGARFGACGPGPAGLGCSVVGVEAHELQQAWLGRALDSAGIDRGRPTGLDAATRLLGDYAAQWDFPAAAVAAWHTGASRPAPGDRHYSTQVFTAEHVGYVHLEFQVSHHVRERDFVVAALFSWQSHPA